MKKRYFLYVGVVMLTALFGTATVASQSQFSPTQTQAIKKIVHDYLVQHPEVLVEASNALQQQQQVDSTKQIKNAISKSMTVLLDDKNKPVAGNLKGNIVIVEFFDYQCPHCKAMVPIIDKIIKTNADVKVIFIEWPFFDDNSKYASEAAIASLKQNKYHDFHNAIFSKGYPLTKDDTLKIAKNIGLDVQKLQNDMKDKAVDGQINDNAKLAQKIKLIGAPAFVIINANTKNFQFIDGQIDKTTIQNAINALK